MCPKIKDAFSTNLFHPSLSYFGLHCTRIFKKSGTPPNFSPQSTFQYHLHFSTKHHQTFRPIQLSFSDFRLHGTKIKPLKSDIPPNFCPKEPLSTICIFLDIHGTHPLHMYFGQHGTKFKYAQKGPTHPTVTKGRFSIIITPPPLIAPPFRCFNRDGHIVIMSYLELSQTSHYVCVQTLYSKLSHCGIIAMLTFKSAFCSQFTYLNQIKHAFSLSSRLYNAITKTSVFVSISNSICKSLKSVYSLYKVLREELRS